MEEHRDMLRQVARNFVAQQDAQEVQQSTGDIPQQTAMQMMSDMPVQNEAQAAAATFTKLPAADANQLLNQPVNDPSVGIDWDKNPAQPASSAQPGAAPQTQQSPGAAPDDPNAQGGVPNPYTQQMIMQANEQQRLQGATQRYDSSLQEGINKSHALAQESAEAHAPMQTQLAAGSKAEIAGKRKAEGIQEQINTSNASFDPEHTRILQERVEAIKQLDDMQTMTMQDTIAKQNQFRDQMMQMANEHPEDVWGNASIGGKISGIIGIVAAGFAGQDASARVQATVQQAVNVQMRKAHFLEEANNEQENIAHTAEQMFGSKRNAIIALTQAKLGVLEQQMKQAAARYANPMAKANLMQAVGQLQQAAATEGDKLVTNVQKDALEAFKGEVELRKAQGIELQSRRMNMGQNGLIPMPGLQGGVDKQSHQKLAPIFGGGHALIEGLDDIEKLSEQIKAAEKAKDVGELRRLQAQYGVLKDGLLLPWRNFADAGKKIEPGEQHLYDNTIPTFLSAATPESISADVTKIHTARDLIVKTLLHTGDAYAIGTARFDPTFPLYQSSYARMQAAKKEGNVSTSTQNKITADQKDTARAEAYRQQQVIKGNATLGQPQMPSYGGLG